MLGENIRKAREALGISQTDLAERISVSKQTLYKYENGIITNVPSDKIEKIALICGVSPAYLMGWDEVKPSDQSKHNYYLDDDTAAMAQALFEDKNYRLLFDAAKDSRPEDLQMVADMLNRLKATNPEG